MKRRSLGACAALAVTASLTLLAATGQAATRTVYAGNSGVPGVPANVDPNAFFRSQVTIHVGDTVQWKFRGFHDIAFLGGGKKPGLILPATSMVTGLTDAAGAPYWFNGQPNLDFNPQIAFPAGGRTFSKTKFTGSGLALGASPKPYKLKFNNTGTFTYYCLVHPGMAARVKVVRHKTHIPTNAQNEAAAKHELKAVIASATKRIAAPTIGGANVEAGRSTSEFSAQRFFPSSLSVKVGTPVTFTMEKDTASEPHTITFGPEAVTKTLEFEQVIPPAGGAGLPEIRANPVLIYPSSPPGPAPVSYDLTNHGNGLENVALLDNDPSTPQIANKTQVSFKTPGAYHYVCVIHEGMAGTITVTP
jgi:plastocyanin